MKRLLLAFLLLFTINTVSAQVSIGPKVGVNFSSFSNTTEGTTGYTSWLIGAAFNWSVGDKFALGSELYYTTIGSENTDSQDFLYVDYLNFPLKFQYRVTEHLNVYVGPSFNFLLAADANENNVDALFKDVNIAVIPGVSYAFENGLLIDARYGFGLSDVGDFLDSKTGSFEVSIGYLFSL